MFEKFRAVSIEQGRFELDPAHYVSAPQMAWDAMLKKTGVTLDLISEPAMYLMIESGMLGGVCVISNRHTQANNPPVGTFNPEQALGFIVDCDANKLCGCMKSHFLPLNHLSWVAKEEWELIDWQRLGDESNQGFIIECDLENRPELHDAHNDNPLTAERLNIQVELL